MDRVVLDNGLSIDQKPALVPSDALAGPGRAAGDPAFCGAQAAFNELGRYSRCRVSPVTGTQIQPLR